MGMKKKLTVELPPETMTLLDKLTEISGTGSRGRTIQLMAETIAGLEQDIENATPGVHVTIVDQFSEMQFALSLANIASRLARFYPRKERKP